MEERIDGIQTETGITIMPKDTSGGGGVSPRRKVMPGSMGSLLT